MADYQGALTGQQIDALPGRIDDIVDGRQVVALAANLNSPTDLMQSRQRFVLRTSGGSASIRSGEARLSKVYGAMTKEANVTESITSAYNTTATEDIPSLVIVDATFKTKVDREVEEGETITVTFTYDGSAWLRNGSAATLAEYGITVVGTPTADDTIDIVYRKAKIGEIKQVGYFEFGALGLNSFDGNYLDGYTIANGVIEASAGSRVYVCRAAYNAENSNGYTVYNKNGALGNVGFAVLLDAGSAVTLVTDSYTDLTKVAVPQEGYVLFEVANNDASGVCVHPAWSGYMDRVYAAYSESWVSLTNYAINAVSASLCDVVDLEAGILTHNVTRVAYTAAALAALLADNPTWIEGTDYVYDASWIYHRAATPTTEIVSVSGIYTVNDFSVEKWGGANVAPVCDIIYGANLIDKLRVDVVTHDEMETEYLPDFDERIEACESSKEMIEAAMLGDDVRMRTICGQPVMLYGAGTPQEAIVPDNWKQFDPETEEGANWIGKPIALGQMYLNTTVSTGGLYVACASGSYDLVWKNV